MSDHDPYAETSEDAAPKGDDGLPAELRDEVRDLQWLMRNKRGRRFMHRLLEKSHVFHTSMTGDAYTFYKEGERNVGLMHLALLNVYCVDEYGQMLKEHQANG